jgi:hypothetical protein
VKTFTDTTRGRRFRNRHGDADAFVESINLRRWCILIMNPIKCAPSRYNIYGVANKRRRSRIKSIDVTAEWVWGGVWREAKIRACNAPQHRV